MAITADEVEVKLDADVTSYISNLNKADGAYEGFIKGVTAGTVVLDQSFSDIGNSAQRAAAATNTAGAKAGAAAGQFKSLGGSTANIAAQFNDIAVQLASGQSPFIIALQQGTQLNQILAGAGKGGVKGALAGIAAGFGEMINPIGLATIGIIAFGGTAIQALSSIIPKTEDATDALKKHVDALKLLVKGYGDSEKAVDDYANAAEHLPVGIVAQGIAKQFAEMQKQVAAFNKSLGEAGSVGTGGIGGGLNNGPAQQVNDLIQQYKNGKIAAGEFAVELDKIAKTDFFDPFNQIHNMVTALRDGALAVQNLTNAYIDLEHASAAAGASVSKGLQIALDSSIASQKSAAAAQVEIDAINAKTPAQKADIARRRETIALQDEEITGALKKQKEDEAAAQAAAESNHQISEADKARDLALNQEVENRKLLLDIVGQSIGKATEMTFVQQHLAEAEAQASASGIAVTKEYRDEVARLGKEYGDLAQKIAISNLQDDIGFARSQIGKSPSEQKIATTLRPIFGDDQTGPQAQFLAQQLRINDALSQTEDFAEGLASSFAKDLAHGKDAGEALLDVFGQLEDKLIDIATQNLVESAFGALTGTGPVGGQAAGGLFSGIGNFFSSLFGGKGHAAGTPNTGGTRGVPAGVVHGQEAVIPLPSGGKIPVMVQGGAGGGLVQVAIVLDDDMLQAQIVGTSGKVSASITKKGISDYDSQLQSRTNDKDLRYG